MKETQLHQPDQVAEVRQTKQQKKIFFLGTVRLRDGHKCFEFNDMTGELRIAEYETSAVDFQAAKKGIEYVHHRVICKEGYVYVAALNVKNATKHLNQLAGRDISALIIDKTNEVKA